MIHYLDCNATTPMDPRVSEVVRRYMEADFGNAGSRTHSYGADAKVAVELARNQIASVIGSDPSEVIFTSGATESNNLAILGLREHLEKEGKTHIVTTSVEHKAVLEPILELEKHGFEVSYVSPMQGGYILVSDVCKLITSKTGLISVMHANNETGVLNPIEALADELEGYDLFFHVDAAQSFGKRSTPLQHSRIDLISVSGHKIYGPKGIGALVARRRKYKRPPLKPLFFGGGQERGLRAGTLPVPLIAGLGKAAMLLESNSAEWNQLCTRTRNKAMEAFSKLDIELNGDQQHCLPNVINISLKNVNSEAAILVLKDLAAISNGSACTSTNYSLSHVLTEMGYKEERIRNALRISWSHMTKEVPWEKIVARLITAQ